MRDINNPKLMSISFLNHKEYGFSEDIKKIFEPSGLLLNNPNIGYVGITTNKVDKDQKRHTYRFLVAPSAINDFIKITSIPGIQINKEIL